MFPSSTIGGFSSLATAVAAASLALAFQTATVRHSYGGDWTGLFCIGEQRDWPQDHPLKSVQRASSPTGFDGQFYLLVAHDPLQQRGLDRYVDWPSLRFQRILVPGLAHLLALGHPTRIAPAYIVVNLVFLLLGSYWTARYAMLHGCSVAWGLLFLSVPAVLISIDRLTVDLAWLAVFCGIAYYWAAGMTRAVHPLIAVLALIRETGLVVAAAFLVHHLLRRRWREAGWSAAATLPALAWVAYLTSRHPPYWERWLPAGVPFMQTVRDLLERSPSAYVSDFALLARLVELVAIGGLAYAIWHGLHLWRDVVDNPIRWTAFLFAVLGCYLLSLGDWLHVYDYGRLMAPLMMWMALRGVTTGHYALLLPALLASVRVAIQMAPQFAAIAGMPDLGLD